MNVVSQRLFDMKRSMFPMVLHRFTSARLGRALQWPARTLGLTLLLGSRLIIRADRRHV